ncbi:MAG: hypothetical protein GX786_02250, partial [Clostridiales bacterium]|nr:hypothetical protein [Clostridiales bacterium]
MYPYLQKAVVFNGQLYGIPINVKPRLIFSYSPVLWKEAGFSPEELPKTHMELLTFIMQHKEEIDQRYPDIALLGGGMKSRGDFIRIIGQGMIHYYQKRE